jgi:hypothetical protein
LRAEVERRFAPRPWTRMLAALRRPVPAYGLALAAMLPLVLWLGLPATPPDASAPPPISTPSETPRPRAELPELTDYDGAAAAPIDPSWM